MPKIMIEIGESVKTFILFTANAVTNDYSPGLISSFIFLLMIFVAVRILSISHQRQHALQTLRKRIVALRSKEDFQQDFEAISDEMNTKKGKPNKQLAFAFSEFGETLIQPKQMGEGVVLNGIRPSVFINLEDLGFSLSGWRFWPGVFVSVGLLMTFLGLIAVLNNTQGLLPDGAVDPQQTIYALKQLLSRASAKFIMSLTGLFCSILLTLLIRRQTRNLNGSCEELNRAIEEKVVFVSLENLATRQLEAIEAQSAEMKLLNSELIAKLSRPLENMADNSMKAVGTMVNDLSSALTEGIGTSLASLGESIDSSAKSMTAVSSALSGAAEQFDRNLTNGIDRLQTMVEQLGTVSGQLAEAANMVSETAGPVLETVRENNTASREIAESSLVMINAAKQTLESERETVVSATQSIDQAIRSFKDLAAAYDGQLEKAFDTQASAVERVIAELEAHTKGIHERFAEALSTLKGVIENAKSFEPESAPPSNENAGQ